MTKVLEVTTAEDVTGHTNSIAITAPDRVTFVKGTCPEESKWWLNILVAFPKSKGRHKRNATFPGAQATTTILQSSNSDAATAAAVARSRHNSYHKDILTSTQSTGVLATTTVSSLATKTATEEKKKTSAMTKQCGVNNGSSKLWSHNDVVVKTMSATAKTGKKTAAPATSKLSNKSGGDVRASVRHDKEASHHHHDDNEDADDDDDEVEDDDDVDDGLEDEEDDGVETGEDDEEDEEEEEEEESGHSTGEECNTKKKSSTSSVHDENNRNAVNEIKNRGMYHKTTILSDTRCNREI